MSDKTMIESKIEPGIEDKSDVKDTKWEPKIVGLLCNWCSYAGAKLAGVSRKKYAPNVRIVRVMCSGRVEPDSS
jgi:hypothetical protein